MVVIVAKSRGAGDGRPRHWRFVTFTLRPATVADMPAMARADGRGFGVHYSDQDIADLRLILDPERFLLACAGDDVVGVIGDYPFRMTLPGGGQLDVPGVTWASVASTHRRRGVLRGLLRAQHQRFVDDGVAVAVLTASEGGIYGRFGYGAGTVDRRVEIDRGRARFRAGVADPGGVREVEFDEAGRRAPQVHERWRLRTPAALSRTDRWWELTLLDRWSYRRGEDLFHLLHADGYASYRIDRDAARCTVVDLFAATDEAHVALWRVLLGLDLVETVETYHCPVDDPLPLLLTDPRLLRTVDVRDGMWVRLLGVPAALAARRYGVEVDVVLDVGDGFLGRGGRFRLRGGPDGADCEPTSRPAQLRVDVATLGGLYLGGHRLSTAVRAGLAQLDDPALGRRLDLALLAERAPHYGTGF